MSCRDLKPENILIAQDGSVKLCDLGLAKTFTNSAMMEGMMEGMPEKLLSTVCGTQRYAAPELLVRHAQPYRCQFCQICPLSFLVDLSCGQV